MKTKLKFISFLLLLIMMISCSDHKNPDAYLHKALENLEQIESAKYNALHEAWDPGDTTAVYRGCELTKEYNNPMDSTIGASYVSVDCDDTTHLNFGYDGNIRVVMYHEHKGMIIDDFSSEASKRLPHRIVSPPFFNYTKSIIQYMLNTKDSITIDFEDLDKEYYYKLTVHEDKQVEFFGKAQYTDNQYSPDPTSVYQLWINKSNNLPYKVHREMSHNISAITCPEAEFNKLLIADFNLYSYFPEDYEVRKYGEKRDTIPAGSLIGTKAPDWTLNDMYEQSISLADIKSKVVLINFTGIGCGPCKVAIPFLNDLKEKYSTDNLEVISIETWRAKPLQLQNYANTNKINYLFLCAANEVTKQYRNNGGVPVFYLLDKNRIVRKVVQGYTIETTDKDITDTINELL